jgi:hypothetical protein
MKIKDVQQAWDDDVLTGELMYTLPSAPQCQGLNTTKCNPHSTPKYGWMPNPKNPDPRTNLNRYDFIRRAGDPDWYWTKGDLAKHGWWLICGRLRVGWRSVRIRAYDGAREYLGFKRGSEGNLKDANIITLSWSLFNAYLQV